MPSTVTTTYTKATADLELVIRRTIVKPSLRGIDPKPNSIDAIVGMWSPQTKEILIDRSLQGHNLQCVLIHELGHAQGLHHGAGVMSSTSECDGYTYQQMIDEIAHQMRITDE